MKEGLKKKANFFRDKTKELGYSDNLRKTICFLVGGEPKIKNEEILMDEINSLLDKKLTEQEFILKAIELATK